MSLEQHAQKYSARLGNNALPRTPASTTNPVSVAATPQSTSTDAAQTQTNSLISPTPLAEAAATTNLPPTFREYVPPVIPGIGIDRVITAQPYTPPVPVSPLTQGVAVAGQSHSPNQPAAQTSNTNSSTSGQQFTEPDLEQLVRAGVISALGSLARSPKQSPPVPTQPQIQPPLNRRAMAPVRAGNNGQGQGQRGIPARISNYNNNNYIDGMSFFGLAFGLLIGFGLWAIGIVSFVLTFVRPKDMTMDNLGSLAFFVGIYLVLSCFELWYLKERLRIKNSGERWLTGLWLVVMAFDLGAIFNGTIKTLAGWHIQVGDININFMAGSVQNILLSLFCSAGTALLAEPMTRFFWIEIKELIGF